MTGSSSPPERPGERACALPSPRCSPGILDEGLAPQEAVDRPRLHSTGEIVHVEPGFDEGAVEALRDEGYDVRLWGELHHYFGGVSVIARAGGGGRSEAKRSGV